MDQSHKFSMHEIIKDYRYHKKTKIHLSEFRIKYYFLYTIHYLSHTYNMAYYYGDLNIAMLKSCKREPLDLPLEVTILHILSLYSNYIIN